MMVSKIIPSLLWICQYYIVHISLSAPFLRFLQQQRTNKSTPAILAFSGIKIEPEQHF
jgi:hypothetical protein